MKFKITKQHSEFAEIFCAEFYDLDDAITFINKAITINNEKNKNPIYWIFENGKLNADVINQDVNPKKLMSRYATGKDELPFQISNPFSVNTIIKKEEITIAKFYYYADAKLFAVTKLNQDEDINAFYCIFDGDKLLERIDKATQNQNNSSSEKKKIFRPTPLPNKPRLGPGGYWVDEDDLDK